ncbi:MAG TPA: S9 family peptidase, partial [Chloroflexota bacterium]|nr:S9 family peptidase [Chloroflexota bacterium]
MNPPAARIEITRDTYFGTVVEDPYRWLEDWKGQEARDWVAAQGDFSRRYLQALPERTSLLARISALSGAAPLLSRFQVTGDRVFYLRRNPGQDLAALVTRPTPEAPERVLFDPNVLEGPVHTAIDWYVASRDGARVALGLSQGGSEDSVLQVLEVDDGQLLGLRISRVMFGNVSWLADNRSFLYHRLSELPVGAPENEKFNNSRTYLHRLGG